jgi:hypothetical protein
MIAAIGAINAEKRLIVFDLFAHSGSMSVTMWTGSILKTLSGFESRRNVETRLKREIVQEEWVSTHTLCLPVDQKGAYDPSLHEVGRMKSHIFSHKITIFCTKKKEKALIQNRATL